MGYSQAQDVRRVLCLAACVLGVLLPATGWAAPQWVANTNGVFRAENVLLGPGGSAYVSAFGYGGATILKYSSTGEKLWSVVNTNIWIVDALNPLPNTAVDPAGGVRMVGSWTWAPNDTWEPRTNQMVIASYSAEGTLLWERRSLQDDESRPLALTVDNQGNTIIVGRTIANGISGFGALIVKYSPDGTLLWTRIYRRFAGDTAYSVLALANNDILVGAATTIVKYNAAGDLLWSADAGGGYELECDRAGNIVIALRSDSNGDSALVKLDADGQLLWRQRVSESGRIQVALDSADGIYVTAGAAFEGGGVVVAKYDPTGRREWISRTASGTYISEPVGIAVDEAGVSITPFGNTAAVRYDRNGAEVWRENYPVAVAWMVGDSGGGIYLTGTAGSSELRTVKFQPNVSPLLPTILSPPQDLEVVEGTNSAVFSVQAGNGPNKFQWRRNLEIIAGATNSTLELTNITWGIWNGYSVIVSNAHGYVVSPEAQLTVHRIPRIYWDSDSGTNRTITVVAGGELSFGPTRDWAPPPLTFEWRRNGVLLPQSNQVLVIDPVTAADAGTYTVVARNPYGSSAALSASVRVVPRTAIDEWRWVQPKPQGNYLYEVAFGAGRFVAVGDLGTLLTSTNGRDWSATNLNNLGLIGVSFGNGRFVALAQAGFIYISTDGLSWTRRQLTIFPRGIKFVNDRFVVYGEGIQSSTDGMTWIDHGSLPATGVGIAAGNGKYIVPVASWLPPAGILISTNLNDWVNIVPDEDRRVFAGVAFGNGIFVLKEDGTELLVTRDGAQFHPATGGGPFSHVSFVAGQFFGYGNEIHRSADGTNWTRVSSGYNLPLTSMAYGNGTYVAVGSGGTIAFSPDGRGWTRLFEPGDKAVVGLAYGHGRYVAITQDRILTASDGETWTSVDSIQGEDFRDIIEADGTFVIVDAKGSFVVSNNGVDWKRVGTGGTPGAIVHDGERFVAAGDRGVILYTNASEYRRVSAPVLVSARDLAFGGGQYVVASDGDYVTSYDEGLLVSSNALDWRNVNYNQGFRSVAYHDGQFVAVRNSEVHVSSNGLVWTAHRLDVAFLGAVSFGGGTWVASAGAQGKIVTSTNGHDWIVHQTPTRGGKVVYVNGAWWILGANRGFMRSGQIEPAVRARKLAAGIELMVQARPGQTYRLQRATTFGAWSDWRTLTPQAETTTVIDNDTSQNAFYRIRSP